MLSKTCYQNIARRLKVGLPADQICLLEGVTPEMVAEAQTRMEEEAKTASKVRSALAEAAGIPEEQLTVAPTGRRGRWITEVSEKWTPEPEGHQPEHVMGVDFAHLDSKMFIETLDLEAPAVAAQDSVHLTNTGEGNQKVELSRGDVNYVRYNKFSADLAGVPLDAMFSDPSMFDRSIRLEWPARQEPPKPRLREELSDLEVRILKLCKKKGLQAHQISGRVQQVKREIIPILDGLVAEGWMSRTGIFEYWYQTTGVF